MSPKPADPHIAAGEAHGGVRTADLRALGLTPDDVIDFSASVNPYGPSPRVRKVLHEVRLDRYPDVECTDLVETLSAHHGLPTDWIVPGNGATELIYAAARAWATPGSRVGHCPPTFGEYEAAARSNGAAVHAIGLKDDDAMSDLAELSLLFLCHPNNPTGELIPSDRLKQALGAMSGVVVLDEAYIQFVSGAPSALSLLDEQRNLLIVRSMTKDYGLTALRLGYAVGHPSLTSQIRCQLPPWSVNGLAQAAGIAALQDSAYLDVTLRKVREAKSGLVRALENGHWDVSAGEANYVIVNVGSARHVRLSLARRALLVRDCQSFGLPEYIRIAVRRPGENRRLVAALADLRSSGELAPRERSTIASIDV